MWLGVSTTIDAAIYNSWAVTYPSYISIKPANVHTLNLNLS